jgi:hypothetical protein
MAEHGYATGHGDAIADLLTELVGQAQERAQGAAGNMLAALKAIEQIFPVLPPPSIAKTAQRNWRLFENVRAAIAKAESSAVTSAQRGEK